MKFVHVLTAFVVPVGAFAQVAHGGRPFGWGEADGGVGSLPEVRLEALDAANLAARDQEAHPGEFRYGVQRFVNADVLAGGVWTDLPDDRRMCRLRISSPGAVMLSLQFDRFHLAPESRVYLYDAARTRYLGGFTEANEQPTGDLATAVLPGDAVVIEYVEPVPARGASQLRLASLTHGYRDIFDLAGDEPSGDYDPGYQSDPCHNNVVCPVGANWQQQASGVAMFLRPDGNGCTGTLINNTANDGTPYFYFANHCYVATTSQWVFYFNYESPTCVGNTGPTTDVMSGATTRAFEYFDDFALVELNATPPTAYNVFYNGWDRSGATPQNQTVIHHPLYDVKKITFDNNPATSTQELPYAGAPQYTYLWRNYWDSGITQAVSSGSPLFDQNKRIIGHMWDGAQTCANATTLPTTCAKFSYSWDGSSPASRLRDWLDPANTTVALDGFDSNGVPQAPLRVKLKVLLQGPFNTSNNLLNGTLRSNGLVPLAEPYTALGYVHVGGGGETTTPSVLSGSSSTSVVDWVVVELRDKNDASAVLATRSALLRRNGTIVDVDGSSDVAFTLPADDYYIAVRHRNHLGIMTQNPQALSSIATLKDLTGTVPLAGGLAATMEINGLRCMFAGDCTMNGAVSYTGPGNDRDPMLQAIGGTTPTSTVSGYDRCDLNMDGVVRYTGTGNDRDLILLNIGGVVPTGVLYDQLP